MIGAVGDRALACAILVANNLRDIAGDTAAGKRTLATRLGDRATRWLYLILLAVATVALVVVSALTTWWGLLALIGPILIIPSVRAVLRGAIGRDLIGVLKATGRFEVLAALGLTAGMIIGALTAG